MFDGGAGAGRAIIAVNEKLDRLNSVGPAAAINLPGKTHTGNFSIYFNRFHLEIKVRFELLKTRHYTQSIKPRGLRNAAEQ